MVIPKHCSRRAFRKNPQWLRLSAILIVSFAVIISTSLPSNGNAEVPKKPIRVLFVTGGEFHDWVNLPPILIKPMEGSGDFEVTLTQDRDALIAQRIRGFDIVAFYTQGGEITQQQKDGLLSFVRRGGGFVGIHGATATWKTSDDYWSLVAGRFDGHGKKRAFDVLITDKTNPITRGIKKLSVVDEDYGHVFYPGDSFHVLALREGKYPAIWTRMYGKGRVFVNVLGHDSKTWNDPDFQRINLRAMYWAAGRAVKDIPFPPTLQKSSADSIR